KVSSAGAASTGGIAALVVSRLCGKNNKNKETDMDKNKNKERAMGHRKGHLAMKTPPIVSPEEWEAARQQLLVKEKELTHARDALAAERRRMPWLAVEKEYEFNGPQGKASLLDLFDGRRQLIIYRAFFEPGVHGWPDHACVGCSMVADHVGHLAHLNARNTTLVFCSRAPQADFGLAKDGDARDRSRRGRAGRGVDRTWDGRERTMKDTRRKETRAMTKHMTGTREEWLSARLELLKAGRGSELTIDNSVFTSREPWERSD